MDNVELFIYFKANYMFKILSMKYLTCFLIIVKYCKILQFNYDWKNSIIFSWFPKKYLTHCRNDAYYLNMEINARACLQMFHSSL